MKNAIQPTDEPNLLHMEEPIRCLIGLGRTIEDLGCEAAQGLGESDLRLIALGRLVHDLSCYLRECLDVAAKESQGARGAVVMKKPNPSKTKTEPKRRQPTDNLVLAAVDRVERASEEWDAAWKNYQEAHKKHGDKHQLTFMARDEEVLAKHQWHAAIAVLTTTTPKTVYGAFKKMMVVEQDILSAGALAAVAYRDLRRVVLMMP